MKCLDKKHVLHIKVYNLTHEMIKKGYTSKSFPNLKSLIVVGNISKDEKIFLEGFYYFFFTYSVKKYVGKKYIKIRYML